MRGKVKLPRPTKVPRPLVREMREHLKKVISLSIENRIAALSNVIQWYHRAIPYLMQKDKLKSPEIIKKLEKAQLCRKKGLENSNLDEKETCYLTALRIYEGVCSALNPIPVDNYYKVFQDKKEILAVKKQRLEAKYGEALRLLQKAIGGRYTLNVADASKPVQYDPHLNSISYNREAARKVMEKYRREGLLAAFVDQLDTFTRDSALVPDAAGNYQYDPVRHAMAMKELLKSFVEFAKTSEAPNRLVKRNVARAPRASGQPRVKGERKEKIAGRFNAGSNIAIVYERLKDEREHDLKEILDGIVLTEPFSTIRHLRWQGNRDKVWTIKIKGDTVQLKHTFPGMVN